MYKNRDIKMIRNNLFSREILTAPITRCIGFFIALLSVVIIDNRFGTLLLDPASIYPFMIMMAVPISLGLKNQWNIISVTKRACIPIGIIVCAMNQVFFLSNVGTYEQTVFSARLMYSPLALGILLSFLLPIIESTKGIDCQPDRRNVYVAFISILLAFILSAKFLFEITPDIQGMSFTAFFNVTAAYVVMLVMGLCFIHPKLVFLNFVEKIYKSSLGIILVSAIFGVSTYVYATATDMSLLGGTVASAVLGIFYGAILALFAIVAGGNYRESDQESMFFEWHMIESYAFYTLIVMPPLSIIEVFSQQGIFN